MLFCDLEKGKEKRKHIELSITRGNFHYFPTTPVIVNMSGIDQSAALHSTEGGEKNLPHVIYAAAFEDT